MCTFVACTMRTQQKNEVLNSDSTSIIDKNDELDSALIVLLIKEDEEKRNIWSTRQYVMMAYICIVLLGRIRKYQW